MMSDTPQSIDAFIAWKVVVHLAEFLAEIRKTAGFNTDPSVHIDFNEWADTPAKYSILLEVAGHNTILESVGPRHRQTVEVRIVGSVSLDDGDIPRRHAMMLEQDVRTALDRAAEVARQEIGRGFSCAYGTCAHDAGLLTPDKQAGFTLDYSYIYPQGAVW